MTIVAVALASATILGYAAMAWIIYESRDTTMTGPWARWMRYWRGVAQRAHARNPAHPDYVAKPKPKPKRWQGPMM